MKFLTFIRVVAARTGQLLKYSEIAKEVDISEPTAKSWMSILVSSNLVYLLQPYYKNINKRMTKMPKIYFLDTGLCAYLTGWSSPEVIQKGAMNGAFFETFVVSEILKSYANEGLDYHFNIYYYRGKDKSTVSDNEIDLIIEEDGIVYPVEIKMTGNPKASMASTNTVLDRVAEKTRGLGVILCMIDKKTYLRDNLVALPISYI